MHCCKDHVANAITTLKSAKLGRFDFRVCVSIHAPSNFLFNDNVKVDEE
jgi:hypothetical protein